jgi:hypothetical protein
LTNQIPVVVSQGRSFSMTFPGSHYEDRRMSRLKLRGWPVCTCNESVQYGVSRMDLIRGLDADPAIIRSITGQTLISAPIFAVVSTRLLLSAAPAFFSAVRADVWD